MALPPLNPVQLDACRHPADMLQILAPPGSGKTLTLTSRLHHLLTRLGLEPHAVIVCTFTIKAAQEIRARIERILGPELAKRLVVGTFHSVARRFLFRYGDRIGIRKGFGIADRDDSLTILKRVIKEHGYSVDPNTALGRISRKKSGKVEKSTARTWMSAEDKDVLQLSAKYADALQAQNLLDYDDLLLRCSELLRKHPECSRFVQAVLVDEFQDTNNTQYDMMKLLAHSCRRITVVGDPDQSIYSFRAAEVKNVGRMVEELENVAVVQLVHNYRSSSNIVELALEIISEASGPRAPVKKRAIEATKCSGPLPTLKEFFDPSEEAEFVASEIHRLHLASNGLLKFSDMAILIRASFQSRQIETALTRASISYRLVGGFRFFDRAEVKLLIDYFRVICEPDYTEAIVRVINVPPRGLGDMFKNMKPSKVVEVIQAVLFALSNPSLEHTKVEKKGTKKVVAEVEFSSRAFNGVVDFCKLVQAGRDKMNEGAGPVELIETLIQSIDFEGHLKKLSKEKSKDKRGADADASEEDIQARMANVNELKALAAEIEAGNPARAVPTASGPDDRSDDDGLANSEDAIQQFLSNVSLSAAGEAGASPDSDPDAIVTISTLHAAKGLEWPVVFVTSAHEGSIPHHRADDVAEERRLLYVGVTRAQALLYLSWSQAQAGGAGGGSYYSEQQTGGRSQFISPLWTRASECRAGPTGRFAPVAASLDEPELAHPDVAAIASILGRPAPSEDDVAAGHSRHQAHVEKRRAGGASRHFHPTAGGYRPAEPVVPPANFALGFSSAASLLSKSAPAGQKRLSAGASLADESAKRPRKGAAVTAVTKTAKTTASKTLTKTVTRTPTKKAPGKTVRKTPTTPAHASPATAAGATSSSSSPSGTAAPPRRKSVGFMNPFEVRPDHDLPLSGTPASRMPLTTRGVVQSAPPPAPAPAPAPTPATFTIDLTADTAPGSIPLLSHAQQLPPPQLAGGYPQCYVLSPPAPASPALASAPGVENELVSGPGGHGQAGPYAPAHAPAHAPAGVPTRPHVPRARRPPAEVLSRPFSVPRPQRRS